MTQSYVKECTYCKAKIRMSDKSGKWLPYNGDYSTHDCRDQNSNGNSKQQEVTLQAVQKKLQDIGIIINVERLMKQ